MSLPIMLTLFSALRAAADNGGALDRVQDLAVFHPIGFAGGEHKLARGDVHLAAAKVGGVQALLDAGHDFFRVLVAAQHVGVGHARHRDMGVALAPAVAGGRHAHQARIHGVLDIALEDAIFNQHIALAGVAFVIHVERAAAVGDGAVVQHGHAFGGHPLANPATESAGALAVEIALQPVANRLVQQDAGPTGAQHHGHFTGRRRARFQIGQRGLAPPRRRIASICASSK